MLRPTLERLSIDVEICQEARKATEILISEKFDAIIVDCDDLQGGLEVLQGLRVTPSNKSSVAFAVLNGHKTTTQEAFGMGANFVLQKPITALNASRCFHAALNFMMRERRRYYRQPLRVPVTMILGDSQKQATTTNISEGGMAILLHQALPKDAAPRVKFTLPHTHQSMEIETQIAWADLKGHAGLRFLNVPQSSQERLDQWLSQQLEGQSSTAKESSPGRKNPPIL